MVTAQSVSFIDLFLHYRNNILPFAGGILDQPNGYMQAMQTIDTYIK